MTLFPRLHLAAATPAILAAALLAISTPVFAQDQADVQFPWSAEFISILFNALARALAIEPSYGLDLGNEKAMEVINYYIDKFDRKIPDPNTTIARLERENAELKARVAALTGQLEATH